jgi:hypothetical protein
VGLGLVTVTAATAKGVRVVKDGVTADNWLWVLDKELSFQQK